MTIQDNPTLTALFESAITPKVYARVMSHMRDNPGSMWVAGAQMASRLDVLIMNNAPDYTLEVHASALQSFTAIYESRN